MRGLYVQDCACVSNRDLKQTTGLLNYHPPSRTDKKRDTLLQECGVSKAIVEGKRLHAHLKKRGHPGNVLLDNFLLQIHVKSGSLADVVDYFVVMDQRNRCSWNLLMTAYMRHGKGQYAIKVFHQMHCESFLPNEFVYTSVISACTGEGGIMHGRHVHTQILASDHDSNVVVLNALITMYSTHNRLEDAKRLFEQALDRNVVSWTSIILAYSQNGRSQDALLMYIQMQQEGVLPNKVTFVTILDACAFCDWLVEGKQVHAYIVGCGLLSEVVLVTSLVNMYGKCGSSDDAVDVFLCVTEPNMVLYTAMITVYILRGHADKALQLYKRMLLEGLLPDNVTYSSVFDGCATERALATGKQVHATLTNSDALQSNIAVATSVISMYGKCGAVHDARHIFDKMEGHNLLSWTSLIIAYVQYGFSREAIRLFRQMQRLGMAPDRAAFWSVVDACTDEGAVEDGKWVHGLIMSSGLESDPGLETALLNMYGKCGELEEARKMFDNLIEKTLVSWTAMVTAYTLKGCGKEALIIYDLMHQQGLSSNKVTLICTLSACAREALLLEGKRMHTSIVSSEYNQDIAVMTALVNMYGNCSSPADARRVFDEMEERNVVTWNTIIAAYSHCGCYEEALKIFRQMQLLGIIPTEATFVGVLDACAGEAILARGRDAHLLASKSGLDQSVDVANALVNMYGKCGLPEDAHNIFLGMHERDAISWNTMIGLFSQHGNVVGAFTLLEEMLMKGHSTDKVTYIAILSACGHTGLLYEGLHYYMRLMENQVGSSTAEHWHCMIHMFARAGLMEEAETFVKMLPTQPTYATWMSLVNAYKGHPQVSGRMQYSLKLVVELEEESMCCPQCSPTSTQHAGLRENVSAI